MKAWRKRSQEIRRRCRAFPFSEVRECRSKPLFDYPEGCDTLEDFLNGFPTVPRALALEEAGLLFL
jgi:hypothetical protein